MAIGSHVFASTENSPAPRKSMRLGEFLLTILVVTTASLGGAVGGLWFAEHGRPAGQQEAVSPQASLQQPGSRVESAAPRLPKADLPSAQVSKAAAKRAEAEVIPLGLPSVRAIHHRSETDYTEISLELRAADVLLAARLHDPERVYFDLADSGKTQRPKGRLKSRRAVPMRDDRVAGVRVVRWESGSVRVVVDLKRASEYSYRLTPGPRSLLTLRLWAHPAADTVADRKPPHQAVTGISEALGPDRP